MNLMKKMFQGNRFFLGEKNRNIILLPKAYVTPREVSSMQLKMPFAMQSQFIPLSFVHLAIIKRLHPRQP